MGDPPFEMMEHIFKYYDISVTFFSDKWEQPAIPTIMYRDIVTRSEVALFFPQEVPIRKPRSSYNQESLRWTLPDFVAFRCVLSDHGSYRISQLSALCIFLDGQSFGDALLLS